ncbi:MAG: hypothetical protein LKM39_09045 [Chiayiivirga sp.]|jgi:hypothetical protein|nr:hypothetical protein [Chiayiivirga sp.]
MYIHISAALIAAPTAIDGQGDGGGQCRRRQAAPEPQQEAQAQGAEVADDVDREHVEPAVPLLAVEQGTEIAENADAAPAGGLEDPEQAIGVLFFETQQVQAVAIRGRRARC